MSFLPLSHPNQPTPPSPPPPSLHPSAPPEPSSAIPADEVPSQTTDLPASTLRSPQPSAPTTPAPIPHPPNFTPFFTLLSNTASSTTHHPSVQYIFSDDVPDNDPITAAALEILDLASENRRNGGHTNDRYVLLDMDATGSKVLSAQSMSPDWAITSVELAPAPTWDDRGGEGVQGGVEGRGLMLRIEGVEVLGSIEGGDGGDGEGQGEGERKKLEELADMYESRMGELRRVVDVGAGVGVIPGKYG